MLDYSGNLLWGFQQMGRHDILDALQRLACDPTLQTHVEWLGSFWGHAVAPSTPIPDLKLHILAWQHQFAALFGREALQRVKGFSLPEMHLPNHPDTLHALVQALRECGYRWLLVQEHSVENLDGSGLRQEQKFIPNQLVARSSSGDTATITALIKTQGSDTKLVGQMQPYHEALGLGRQSLGATTIPSLVSQIADGENGGVMMNEFPPAFLQAHHTIASQEGDAGTVAINGTEYLELLDAAGVHSGDFPMIQAVHQHTLWQRVGGPPTLGRHRSGHRRAPGHRSLLLDGWRLLDQQPQLGGGLRQRAGADPSPQCPVSPGVRPPGGTGSRGDPDRALSGSTAPSAAAGNQLLPLLGARDLD